MAGDDYSDLMGQVMFSKLSAQAVVNNPCWEVAKAIVSYTNPQRAAVFPPLPIAPFA